MKTRFIFPAIILLALISCTNQAPEQEKKNEPKQETAVEEVTRFRFEESKEPVVANGENIERYKNGVIKMQGKMKDGKREGLWKSYYEDGTPWSETTFSAGIKNGKTTTWYANGNKRYEGAYMSDSDSGKWTYWDEQGKQVNTQDYGKK